MVSLSAVPHSLVDLVGKVDLRLSPRHWTESMVESVYTELINSLRKCVIT